MAVTVNASTAGIVTRAPYIFAQSGVPVVLLSSATNVTATGAFTGLTALPYTPSGVVQIYVFAAGTGGPAVGGLFYAIFSSTTACQAYTDVAGTVTVSGWTAGAYAGGITEATLMSVVLPGGTLGNSGGLRIGRQFVSSITANNKNPYTYLGATVIHLIDLINGVLDIQTTHRNRGVQDQQQNTRYNISTGNNAGSFNANMWTSVNTVVNQTLKLTSQLVVATDFVVLEGYTIEVLPS